jgi:hypothetical protein
VNFLTSDIYDPTAPANEVVPLAAPLDDVTRIDKAVLVDQVGRVCTKEASGATV